MSPPSVSVTVITMPGQADHCGVGVEVGAVGDGNGVSEGKDVAEGVEVRTAVGMEINVAVTVGITGVSLGRVEGKFELGLDTLRLHAWSMGITIVMKNNGRKYFLIRMIASIH